MTNERTLQESLILERIEVDRKVEAQIRAELTAAFPDPKQLDIMIATVLKVYDLETALRESEVHEGYMVALLDGVTDTLIKNGIVTEEQIREATQEAHDKLEEAQKASEKEYYRILDAKNAQANPVDKVTTI